MTAKCVLEVGDMAKDKSDSNRFSVVRQSWILGGGGCCPAAHALWLLALVQSSGNMSMSDVQA